MIRLVLNSEFGFRILPAALCLFLLACGNNNNGKDGGLLYWSSNNSYEIEFARVVTKTWNAQSDEHAVRFQPVPEGRSSEEIILAAVVGKTTPDIYSNMWQGDVEYYARAGVLVPLDTIPGFMEFLYQRCDSAVVKEITSSDGHIYQIPWKTNPIMLLYNKNLLKGIGYDDPPRTYSEFLDAAEKFKQDTDGDGYVDRWIGNASPLVTWLQRFFDFYPLYLGASGGGHLVKDGSIVFDNQYAVQVFDFVKTLYDNQYFARERLDARQDAFLQEVIATRFTGPWDIARLERWRDDSFDYAFAPLPVPDGHQGEVYTYGDPKNIVIFKTCKNPNKAWAFLKFLINRENDLRLLKITSQLPRRKKMFSDPDFKNHFAENPKLIPFARQVKYTRGTDASPVLKEIFDVISQEYEACVIYGTKPPEEAIEAAAQAAEILLY